MVEPRASKPDFPSGYGLTGEQLLPWSWAVERLEASRNYWVITTRRDGRPHAMPVWGIWWEDGVVFGASPSSTKARNIERDPRVVVHLESGDEVVILEGTVDKTMVDDAYVDAYESKYAHRPQPGGPYLRLRPTRAYAWRESDYPHSATRFDWD